MSLQFRCTYCRDEGKPCSYLLDDLAAEVVCMKAQGWLWSAAEKIGVAWHAAKTTFRMIRHYQVGCQRVVSSICKWLSRCCLEQMQWLCLLVFHFHLRLRLRREQPCLLLFRLEQPCLLLFRLHLHLRHTIGPRRHHHLCLGSAGIERVKRPSWYATHVR